MKILFVEDNESVINQMKSFLEDSEYEFVFARDGTEGLGELALGGIDLVISDLHMPRMDGLTMLEFYDHLRTKNIKKIMLTSDINPELVEKGKALGVVAWLTKPLKKENILRTLKNIEEQLKEK